MTAWWAGIAPAEIIVDCGEHRHRVRWERGQLLACDHEAVEDERALAALGGRPLACIELVRAWERHRADLRALVIGPRGGADELHPDPDDGQSGVVRRRRRRGSGFATMVSSSSGGAAAGGSGFSRSAHAESDDVAVLTALLTLGAGFGERLVATVAAEVVDRLRDGDPLIADALPRLDAALYGRVLAALRGWLGEPRLSLELTLIDHGAPRSLARVDGAVHAALPFDWVLEVWARELETVQGRFCLAAETDGAGDWQLATVAPDLRTTERIELRIR